MYVTLTVQVSDTEYTYQGTSGQAELKMELPMPVVHFVEPSKMFIGLLEAALENYEKALDEKEIPETLGDLVEEE